MYAAVATTVDDFWNANSNNIDSPGSVATVAATVTKLNTFDYQGKINVIILVLQGDQKWPF